MLVHIITICIGFIIAYGLQQMIEIGGVERGE